MHRDFSPEWMVNAINWKVMLVLTGMIGACSSAAEHQSPSEPAPFFRPVKTALVTGTVTTAAGVAVPNVRVTATVFFQRQAPDECRSNPRVTDPEVTVTDSAGKFAIEFNVGRSPPIAGCLRLEIIPDEESGLESRIINGVPLTLAAAGQPDREVNLEIVLTRQ